MRVTKSMFIMFMLLAGFVSRAQNNIMQPDTKLIAVVNRANWCRVCKANEARFASLLSSYKDKGVTVLVNDVTNDSAIAASKKELENADVYNAVYSVKRKGFGKMMQSCGLAKNKKQDAVPSGIVTFINPQTHKRLEQLSMATPDEEMKNTINHLLN